MPRIAGPTDVSNFSDEFTSMQAVDAHADTPESAYDGVFRGYSFVAPSIIFAESNVISDDLFRRAPDRDKKPTASNLVGCILKKSPFFSQYELDLKEKILGDGSFSVCRRCVHKQTRQEFAVKIVSRRVDCSREISLLRACQGHPNIVRLVDVMQDDVHTYIVMEYLRGGELLHRIRRKSKFDEAQAAKILTKLMSAVNFMHFQVCVCTSLNVLDTIVI